MKGLLGAGEMFYNWIVMDCNLKLDWIFAQIYSYLKALHGMLKMSRFYSM